MKHSARYLKALLFGSFIGSLIFSSCQRDYLHFFNVKGGKFGTAIVFVAGYESDGVNGIAKCWVDGQEITLSDGTKDARANSIFVDGIDMYVAGNDGGPVFWKNNGEVYLSINSTQGSANSIYRSGGHTYVAGSDGNSAVYWKDGVEVILGTTDTFGNFPTAGASSVFIAGNDIYIAGFHGPNAVYWKNGVEVYLSNLDSIASNYSNQSANSIFVNGGDVYAAGVRYDLGAYGPFLRYWKNGVDETAGLSNSNFIELSASSTNAVFVSGNTTYVTGMGLTVFPTFQYSAAYWNNGNMIVLPSNGTESLTTDIYVKGNDVFVSGSESQNSQSYAVYWKNGSKVYLTDGANPASANSIFIR
jgi:hypothetical protein